jgi:kexin
MLEANPSLTWRDVQAILVSAGQRVDDQTDDSAAVNGAGNWHSNQYGFGIIDAAAAVEAAETWQNLGSETVARATVSGLDLIIPDDSMESVVTSITLDDSDLVAETVHVYISLDHSSRGHLEILLTSPSGMVSELVGISQGT